jgi:predicted double-glycine peptidase
MAGTLSKTARASTRGKRVIQGRHVLVRDPSVEVSRVKLANFSFNGRKYSGLAWLSEAGNVHMNAEVYYKLSTLED